jgi:hypothetical protein
MSVEDLTGRDLDAAIAEEVLGWKLYKVGKDYDGKNECEVLTPNGDCPKGYEFPRSGLIHRGFLAPEFHRNLHDAISLAKHAGNGAVRIDGELRDMPTLISRSVLAAHRAKAKGE